MFHKTYESPLKEFLIFKQYILKAQLPFNKISIKCKEDPEDLPSAVFKHDIGLQLSFILSQ
jgi:hypothetical protein